MKRNARDEARDKAPDTFPYTRTDNVHGTSVTVYREPDRAALTYRIQFADGHRSKKRSIPKSEREARRKPVDNSVPLAVVEWVEKVLAEGRSEQRTVKRAAKKMRGNRVPLEYIFQRVRESEWFASHKEQESITLVMRWVLADRGPGFLASQFDEDTILGLLRVRVAGLKTTNAADEPTHLKPVKHNTAVRDLRMLNTIFERATRLKFALGLDQYLLDTNPLDRFGVPVAHVRESRSMMTDAAHRILLRLAPTIDPTGRFEFLLMMLRWSGRRVITVRRMTGEVFLTTEQAIFKALGRQKCRYIRDEHGRADAARLYMELCGGALYVRWFWEKAGQNAEANRVEQYDAVVPIPPVLVRAWEKYCAVYRDPLGLEADAALIPGKTLNKPISERQVQNWMKEAKLLALKEGLDLDIPDAEGYHGYRSKRRTDFVNTELKYARFLIGHSIRTATPGISVSESVYLGIVPEELAHAVRRGRGAV